MSDHKLGTSATCLPPSAITFRAGNGTRTRDPNLGKVVLYQLSYSRTIRASARSEIRVAIIARRSHQRRQTSAYFAGPVEARGIEPLTS